MISWIRLLSTSLASCAPPSPAPSAGAAEGWYSHHYDSQSGSHEIFINARGARGR